jgi:hypothetical protein
LLESSCGVVANATGGLFQVTSFTHQDSIHMAYRCHQSIESPRNNKMGCIWERRRCTKLLGLKNCQPELMRVSSDKFDIITSSRSMRREGSTSCYTQKYCTNMADDGKRWLLCISNLRHKCSLLEFQDIRSPHSVRIRNVVDPPATLYVRGRNHDPCNRG